MSGVQKNMTVNKLLTLENKKLKKSLKAVQDAFEDLREKNHALDKENGILGYRLTIAFIPEALKFLSSSVGTAFAISLYFAGKTSEAVFVLVVSVVVFCGILFLYRKS